MLVGLAQKRGSAAVRKGSAFPGGALQILFLRLSLRKGREGEGSTESHKLSALCSGKPHNFFAAVSAHICHIIGVGFSGIYQWEEINEALY